MQISALMHAAPDVSGDLESELLHDFRFLLIRRNRVRSHMTNLVQAECVLRLALLVRGGVVPRKASSAGTTGVWNMEVL